MRSASNRTRGMTAIGSRIEIAAARTATRVSRQGERTSKARTSINQILDIMMRKLNDPRPANIMGEGQDMTVYKRGNRWHAQVDLPDRGDGKRHRRAATFRTERLAKQQEARWVAERTA